MSFASPVTFVRCLGTERLDTAGTVIALTPTAYDGCIRRGLQPTVIDDHVRRPDFYYEPDRYWRWQLDWLRRLDQAVGGDGIVLACAQLISVPISSVVVAARLLSTAVDAIDPDCVRYVGRMGIEEVSGYHNGHLQFWPRLGDQPLAARLLPLIANSRGLPYEGLNTDEAYPPDDVTDGPVRRAARGLGRMLGPYRRARFGPPRLSRPLGTTLMLWYAGYGARTFDADERRRGRDTVFLTRGGPSVRIIDPTLPLMRSSRSLADFSLPASAPLPPSVLGLLDEVDQWTQVNGAAQILERRVAHYLKVLCPVVSRAASAIAPELERLGIDRVAAANPSSLEELASLVAAGRKGILRTLVQHGDHLFSYGYWLVTETQNFEELAASDPTVGADFEEAAQRIGTKPPKVTFYSPRVDELLSTPEGVKALRGSKAGPICYVPCMLMGESNVIGGSYLEDAWYHRWHLRLLDAMAARPELTFVWKGLPAADQTEDTIPKLLAERGLANVVYESRPFLTVVNGVERVFLDFPSTALYEAARLGLPVLAVSFRRFVAIRRSAQPMFARSFRVCDTEDEAIRHFQRFLDDDPKEWVVPADNLALKRSDANGVPGEQN